MYQEKAVQKGCSFCTGKIFCVLLVLVTLVFIGSSNPAEAWQGKDSFFEEDEPPTPISSAKPAISTAPLQPGQRVVIAPFALSNDIVHDIGEEAAKVQERRFLRYIRQLLEKHGYLVEVDGEGGLALEEQIEQTAQAKKTKPAKQMEIRDEQGKRVDETLTTGIKGATEVLPDLDSNPLKRSVGTLSGGIGYAKALDVESTSGKKGRSQAAVSLAGTVTLLQESIGAKAFFIQIHSTGTAVVSIMAVSEGAVAKELKEKSIELALQRLADDTVEKLSGVPQKKTVPVKKGKSVKKQPAKKKAPQKKSK